MKTTILCVLLAWTMTARGQWGKENCRAQGLPDSCSPSDEGVTIEYVLSSGISTSLYKEAYAEDDQDAPEIRGMSCYQAANGDYGCVRWDDLFIPYGHANPLTTRQWSIDKINEFMHQSPDNPPAKNTHFFSILDDRTGVTQNIDIAPDGKITLTGGLTMEDAVLILAGRIAEIEKETQR